MEMRFFMASIIDSIFCQLLTFFVDNGNMDPLFGAKPQDTAPTHRTSGFSYLNRAGLDASLNDLIAMIHEPSES